MSDTQLQDSVTSSRTTSSPGEMLLRQREELGVPIGEAARALNLRPAVVDGLEHDHYDEIPVIAYRRGYLRSYAKYLGLSEHMILDAYQERYGAADAERKVIPVAVSRPPSKLGAWLFKLVTLLVIAGLIGVTVMWWQSRGGSEPPGFNETSSVEEGSEVPPVSDTGAEPTPPQQPTITSPAQPENDTATGDTAGNSETLPTDNAEQTATVDESAALDIAADTDAANTDAADADEGATEEAATAPAGNPGQMELTFNEQSWTEIFDANNQRVFVGLQTPGTNVTVEGVPPFRLTVGNATGVVLRYQGEQINLAERAGANNVARFTLGE
ncbi:RodZ domain-containing protein [Halomonas sp. AOP27-A1-41]|uniref:RodZ domain-containing protein n=1 Tax=Halomonas sp. AOP27-A1-41 TaxID=3457707 RepID=UPI004034C8D5